MAAKGSLTLNRLPVPAKVGVGVGMALLVALAYFVVFYGDVSSAITAQQRQEQNLRADLGNARQSEFAYHKDLAELTDRQQRQRELNKVLPETTEYPSFLSAIQGVANVAGVALNAWAPLDEVKQQFFAKVPMKLTLHGRFHQIAKFFWGVGQLDRIINVENISLTEPKLNGDEVGLKVECLATAFHTLPTTTTTTARGPGAPPPGGTK